MPAAACVALLLIVVLLGSPFPLLAPGQALLLVAVAAVAAGWRGGRRAALVAVMAGLPVLAAVDASTAPVARPRGEPAVETDLDVAGSVCEFPRDQSGSWRFVLTTDSASRARGAPEKVLVSWYAGGARPAGPPSPGEQWQLRLHLRAPRGLSNPGGFDYERWLFAQHIGATGWVRESPGNGRLAGSSSVCPAAAWRSAIARRVAAALEGRESAAYVLGLSIGAYQALPEVEWSRLRRTGTIHLISISGFHIALVAGPAALLGVLLGRGWLAAGRRCRPRVVGAWTGFLVACLYALLAGFSVPTARSVVAVGLVAVFTSSRRALTSTELLATVVLGVLLVEPLAPLIPGFWLSFAGVTVLAAVALGSRRARPGPVRALLLVQAGMSVALAPLLAVFFGQLPLSGALANFVAVPAFSFLLLPLTLLGTTVTLLAPGTGAWILGLAADCFDAWRWFLARCAELPFAVWYLPEPAPWAAVLAGLGAIIVLWPPPSAVRGLGLALFAGLLAPAAGPVPAEGLRLTVLDVGQGLAILVQTTRHALVYDTGPAFRSSDAGERVVVPALQALGVGVLDALVVSHADADHRGGAASLAERYPPHRLLGAGFPGWPAEPCQAGDSWQWDGFDFAILNPARPADGGSDNASSCVLQISGAGVRLLLPGDIPAAVERDLLDKGLVGPTDLVIAAHHGSRTSSSAGLVEATRPRYVVFATGYRNRWHFPADVVTERWRQSGACLLNTAEEGALRFEITRASGLRLRKRQRRSAPGVWLARPANAVSCD
ncbi:MAG: DNA internalization-related competence protein ComEC/Rec2 [Gammaproteobacteria bacterium]